jgi:predicted transposase YbfD/YdcC
MSDHSDLNEKALLSFQTIENHFKYVKDYRRYGSVKHQLLHIFFFTLCAVTAGANDLVGIHTWIKANEAWLNELFKLEHGVPSLSTLRITYMLLDPTSLSECFAQWVRDMVGRGNLRGICIDGKAQRGTALPDEPNSFVHIVSAWATDHGLTLGQQKVDGKSNEITAIPKLLDLVDIEGTVITIDAMGTQKNIAEKIVDKGADYILALKGNQSKLNDEVENFFGQAIKYGDLGIEFYKFEFEGEGKGRHEIRRIYTATEWNFLEDHKLHWKGLSTIICIESEVTKKEVTSKERRYYISSLQETPEKIVLLIRGHWGIESTHWILDVAFREDNLTARAGNISENLSLIRRISLNYLTKEKTAKLGTANKCLKVAYDKAYLLKVLGVKSFS